MSKEVCIATFTSDGHFPLTLVGVGDGGPHTRLKEAWLTLPGLSRSRTVLLMKDFEPGPAVVRAGHTDKVHEYLAEAHTLISNPALRAVAEQLAETHCLNQILS